MASVTTVLKTALSVGLIGFGVRSAARYVLIDDSYQAAVVAATAMVRAPIAGYIEQDFGSYGKLYEASERIVEIEARSNKDEHLHEAEVQLSKVQAQMDALARVGPQIGKLSEELRRSSTVYDVQRASQLRAEADQVEEQLKGAVARAETTATRLKRTEALVAEGIQTQDSLEQVNRDRVVAEHEVSAFEAAKAEADGVLSAARSGVQVGSFGADKAYSAQRVDELKLRLTDWRTQYETAQAEASSLVNQVALERNESSVRRHAVLQAPVRGRLWQTFASPRDYVSEGAPLMRLASCAVPMVAASVSERIYNGIHIGQEVTFRSSSTGEKLKATVTQTFGVMPTPATTPFDWGLVPNSDVAFGVSAARGKQGLVLLRLAHWPTGLDCQVGATGEVLFSVAPWARWLW